MRKHSRARSRPARWSSPGVSVAMRLFCALAFAPLPTTGCASAPATPSTGVSPGPNLITADEVAQVNAQNAYEVVQKLRPAMLRRRQTITNANAQATGEVLVYMDNYRLGSVDQLRQIAPSTIATIRYFTASEAQLKWGSGHPSGVIEVTTKR